MMPFLNTSKQKVMPNMPEITKEKNMSDSPSSVRLLSAAEILESESFCLWLLQFVQNIIFREHGPVGRFIELCLHLKVCVISRNVYFLWTMWLATIDGYFAVFYPHWSNCQLTKLKWWFKWPKLHKWHHV